MIWEGWTTHSHEGNTDLSLDETTRFITRPSSEIISITTSDTRPPYGIASADEGIGVSSTIINLDRVDMCLSSSGTILCSRGNGLSGILSNQKGKDFLSEVRFLFEEPEEDGLEGALSGTIWISSWII